jgi:Fusaric acid resistance protein-like
MKSAIHIKVSAARKWVAAGVGRYRARLLFCLRVTTAAVMAFAVAGLFALPFHGLWAVLTAVVVIQMSLGASLRATSDYVVGTLCGAVYASAVGLLFPQAGPLAMAAALALAVAPVAFAATLSPMFRAAPFTAVLVFLISSQLGESPIESGLFRLLEVGLGGGVALAVSIWLFPERAHGLGADAAAGILTQLAQALRQLLQGVTHKIEADAIRRVQDETGRAVTAFQDVIVEAEHERLISFLRRPDPGPLSRTLLRLRHDLVIIGRAAAEPLPEPVAQRLDAPVRQVATAYSEYLDGTAAALASRASPPPLHSVETALEDYTSEIGVLRRQGLTRHLSGGEMERLFALGFAFDQLADHFADLARCVREWAERPNADTKRESKPENFKAARADKRSEEGITGRSADAKASGELPCTNT